MVAELCQKVVCFAIIFAIIAAKLNVITPSNLRRIAQLEKFIMSTKTVASTPTPVANAEAAQLTFATNGSPISSQFDDIYFNPEAGLAESSYVFLQHNQIPTRWHSTTTNFVTAETGFGSGLNLCALWLTAREAAAAGKPFPNCLHHISFEKYPLTRAQIEQILTQASITSPALQPLVPVFTKVYPITASGMPQQCYRVRWQDPDFPLQLQLDLWVGDILQQLPAWLPHALHKVDAWFLDGFAPAKNRDMWQPQLFQAMATSAKATGTFATFTAVGEVKRGLQAAGFSVQKVAGFGRKRDMLCGVRATPESLKPEIFAPQPSPHDAIPVAVVGGGIAAATLSHQLTQRGIRHQVIAPALATGASGNPQAAVYPLLQGEANHTSAFYSAAFLYAQQFYRQHLPDYFHQVGVVQHAHSPERALRYQKLLQLGYSDRLVVASTTADLLYPLGGWIAAAASVKALIQQDIWLAAKVQALQPTEFGWHLTLANGRGVNAQQVVLACGHESQLTPELFIQPVRGQVTFIDALPGIDRVHCAKGYLTPLYQQQHCVGATYARGDIDSTSRAEDDIENLEMLGSFISQPAATRGARASVRATTRDHLPLLGQLQPQLWVLSGLGSRGFTSAPLCAATLVSMLTDEPLPLSAELVKRLSLQRAAASAPA